MGKLRASEYFAGIGLARIGLENAGIEVVWSNDISRKKAALFRSQFGDDESGHELLVGDLADVSAEEMPSGIDIGWASFPCTDLSLAGARGGIHAGSSAAYWSFIRNISALGTSKPKVLAIENVTGFANSNQGRDISTAISALNGLGYSVDVLSIDSRRFVPQSRPRLFLLAVLGKVIEDPRPSVLRPHALEWIFADPALRTHRAALPEPPELLASGFSALADRVDEHDIRWWDKTKVASFTSSLTAIQSTRLAHLASQDEPTFRTAFRRMRNGAARWEIRRDDIAGCLRTASGGSSVQAVVLAGRGKVGVRWMTPAEYAKLMGAPYFELSDQKTRDIYSGFGDAVCVPVVEWLARNAIIPALHTGIAKEVPLSSSR
ncbi:DNA cytosine methyltransferase [Salinibacterium sp. SWN248]|uniref:DNA cytosine methyltransferase n=1 Tax=Salinibacterium sp. SWN248 TaxID=2792056 RepID=UPI0018CF0849|nr:DNA (cytosine-5-)-methyltransferase [Salinibacterium sp. SWN248]MBH0024401.1 DNA (cytosine-5-)-methyltransferase [Salinibacterium sp. SWN248]